MTFKKRKNFNIELILAKLSQERKVNPDGSISTPGFGYLNRYESYLRTAIVAEGKSDSFIRNIVSAAVRVEQHLTEDKFVKHCNRIANARMRNNCQKFKVVFPIWGETGLISGLRRWGDVSITFNISTNSAFARRAKIDRNEQFNKYKAKYPEFSNVPADLPLAVCTVKAIDVRDAFEQAESAISKELGLYSLITGRGEFLFNNGRDRPVNTVLLAPHMTVHDVTGRITEDMFWYNRWCPDMPEKRRNDIEIERIQKRTKQIRNKLRKLPWRDDAENALGRYYSAFGQCDLEASFLDGWRLLEAIGGHSSENSETLVKRAAWFFEERDENIQIGLHLMYRRNLISHGRPLKDENNEGLVFQMKYFITPLLYSYLTNPFKFKSIKEFWDFCDLPHDRSTRLRRAYLLKCGAKFRREE